ncbi:hypothetical protein, partial [Marinobacter sp. LN3S78]|uniref:hypothetical protein n=1 Tax=Marinobacter sp. LN3S78 TaxID=3382300 RepID=UPI00387B248C
WPLTGIGEAVECAPLRRTRPMRLEREGEVSGCLIWVFAVQVFFGSGVKNLEIIVDKVAI